MSLTTAQESRLLDTIASPPMSNNPVSGFAATVNAVTKGADISFELSDSTGVAGISLIRNFAMDPNTGIVLQTWNAQESKYTWSDTDAGLQTYGQAYYWLVLSPVGVSGTASLVGPQTILLNPQLVAPLPATAISASHSVAVNGYMTVTVNVNGVTSGSSISITATGYQGSASPVAVAQSGSSPLQFKMKATGETVTLKALTVSSGGIASTTGPTTTVTLSGGATVPASPQGVSVAQISTGNEISFPANRDVVTSYQLYRGQRGSGFLGATLLATISPGTGTLQYLDTTGLAGDWEYYVVAVGPAGSSAPSPPSTPPVMYSSANLPPNVPTNTTNTATVDSLDAGSTALGRVYGPGGAGTSYSHFTGFGTLTRPNGSIAGLLFLTWYFVLYDTINATYVATDSYPDTLPDGYEYVGYFQTCADSAGGGTGATADAVIDGSGHVIQINATAPGTDYVTGNVTVSIAGGGGSDAQATANIDPSTGGIPSYTVTKGGTLYATAPIVTVVGAVSAGLAGGGGDDGTGTGFRGGCVLEGTPVEAPEGTLEERLPERFWRGIIMGDKSLVVAPATLVSVFKRADELTTMDRIEIKDEDGNSRWRCADDILSLEQAAWKVKRTCPGGVYFAGPERVRLHNMKSQNGSTNLEI